MNRKYTNLCIPLVLCAWVHVPVAKAYSQGLAVRKQYPTQRRNAAPHHRALASPATLSSPAQAISARPMVTSHTDLTAPTTNIGFQAASHISSGTTDAALNTLPYRCALGDFNGDGKQDIAALVQDPSSSFWLSILLSYGDGTFQQPVLTSVNFGTNDFLTVGDLNRDGKADVVLVHSNSIDVFIGDGTGHFAAPVNYLTNIANPVAASLIDANGDTLIDVIVASGTIDFTGNSPVQTLLGNGLGALGTPSTAHYPGTVTYGVFADLNGDGHPDLASSAQVFWGTSGDFQGPITLTGANTCAFPFGAAQGSVVVADVNGNGRPDIVTADCWQQTITTFVNLGSASFAAGISTWAAYTASTVTIADVNGDGKPDAIVGDLYSLDMMVLLGNNDGTFTPAPFGYPAGGDLWTPPLIADFNSDGRPDIVVPSGISDEWASLVYLGGLGDGTFVAPHDYFVRGGAQGSAANSWGIASADLNGDGLPDYVVGNLSNDPNVGVTVYLSNAGSPSKFLHPGVNYGSGGNLQFVALADIDGDGKLDLIASNTVPGSPMVGSVQIFLGNVDGTFQTNSTTIPVISGAGLGQLVVKDFNGDNKPDIAVLDTGTVSALTQAFTGNVWVLLNISTLASPSFAAPVNYSLTSPGGEIAAADLGNGHTDLAVNQPQSTGAISILLGDGKGVFAAQPDFDINGFYPAGLTIAKLNPSPTAHPDLIVAIDDSNGGMGIAVASGNGDGTFNAPVLYPTSSNTASSITSYPAEVRVADLNGDGNLDLVFTNFGDGTVGVLYGTGQWGSGQNPFYAPVDFAVNDSPLEFLLVDVNGDGSLDAVMDSASYSGLTTFLNTGSNKVTLSSSSNPSASGTSVTFTAAVTATPLAGEAGVSPTGSVTFNDNLGGPLGTVALSGGVATFSTSSLAMGAHVVTAIYSGDDNLIGQTVATLAQNVNALLPAYALSASPMSATLHPGQSANFVVTATPNPEYVGTVNFSCGTLPAGITCLFNPPSINLSGISPATTTLTVTVTPNLVASSAPTQQSYHAVPMTSMTFGLLGFIALGASRRSRRTWSSALVVVALALILAATGCSGSGNKLVPTPVPQVTPIKVVAASRGAAQQLNLTLNIQR